MLGWQFPCIKRRGWFISEVYLAVFFCFVCFNVSNVFRILEDRVYIKSEIYFVVFLVYERDYLLFGFDIVKSCLYIARFKSTKHITNPANFKTYFDTKWSRFLIQHFYRNLKLNSMLYISWCINYLIWSGFLILS